jgi:hypothetical protein
MKTSYLKIAFILLAAFALKNVSFAADKAAVNTAKKSAAVSLMAKNADANLAVQ